MKTHSFPFIFKKSNCMIRGGENYKASMILLHNVLNFNKSKSRKWPKKNKKKQNPKLSSREWLKCEMTLQKQFVFWGAGPWYCVWNATGVKYSLQTGQFTKGNHRSEKSPQLVRLEGFFDQFGQMRHRDRLPGECEEEEEYKRRIQTENMLGVKARFKPLHYSWTRYEEVRNRKGGKL